MYREQNDILGTSLFVRFANERAIDLGGATRDLFTTFWLEISKQYFKGEGLLVPFVKKSNIRNARLILPTLGQILSHSTGLCNGLPINFCSSTLINHLYGIDCVEDENLYADYMVYLTSSERELFTKAAENFEGLTQKDKKDIEQFIYANDGDVIPQNGEALKRYLITTASTELCDTPLSLMRLLFKNIPALHKDNFWNSLSPADIVDMCNVTIVTVDKVLAKLKQKDGNDSPSQNRTFHYLHTFLSNCSNDLLISFLHFVTSMRTCPKNIIIVEVSTHLCNPVAHTCTNTLELPVCMGSQQQFTREWELILRNPFSFVMTRA